MSQNSLSISTDFSKFGSPRTAAMIKESLANTGIWEVESTCTSPGVLSPTSPWSPAPRPLNITVGPSSPAGRLHTLLEQSEVDSPVSGSAPVQNASSSAAASGESNSTESDTVIVRPLVVGIAGGIASGKTTATQIINKIFQSEISAANSDDNLLVVDADKLGHAAYAPGTACFDKVVAHFGPIAAAQTPPAVLVNASDGTINRPVLGSIVFADADQRRTLESIVWPEIVGLMGKAIQDASAQVPKQRTTGSPKAAGSGKEVLVNTRCIMVIEAAIMIEAGANDLVDALVVVHADPAVATQRLMERNKLTEQAAKARLAAQLSNSERLTHAHFSIANNTGNLANFEAATKAAWDELRMHFNCRPHGEAGSAAAEKPVLFTDAAIASQSANIMALHKRMIEEREATSAKENGASAVATPADTAADAAPKKVPGKRGKKAMMRALRRIVSNIVPK